MDFNLTHMTTSKMFVNKKNLGKIPTYKLAYIIFSLRHFVTTTGIQGSLEEFIFLGQAYSLV